MLSIGPVSSLFDFLTFFVLLRVLSCGRGAVPYRVVRRVAGDADAGPLRHPHGGQPVSQPAEPGARLTVLLVVGLRLVAIPFTPLAGALGFVPLPLGFFLFLAAMTGAYLTAAELVKQQALP